MANLLYTSSATNPPNICETQIGMISLGAILPAAAMVMVMIGFIEAEVMR